jgi:hypothetical protein
MYAVLALGYRNGHLFNFGLANQKGVATMLDVLFFIIAFGGYFGFVLFVWFSFLALREVLTDLRRRRIRRDQDDA